jgi:hypothetical protein
MISLSQLALEISSPQHDYQQSKEHSKHIDDLLEFKIDEIESSLINFKSDFQKLSTKKFWIGLDSQIFQTPYDELFMMAKFLKPSLGEVWVDLGAAYGRMGIVLELCFNEVSFIGYEMVLERVNEGNRIYQQLNLMKSQLLSADIAADDFLIPDADLYFIYDFGSREDIYKILEKLQTIARKKKVRVVARGRGIRQWILKDCPWLTTTVDPIHFENWSVFIS